MGFYNSGGYSGNSGYSNGFGLRFDRGAIHFVDHCWSSYL